MDKHNGWQMRIPFGGIKRVQGKIQKPRVMHSSRPVQTYRFGAEVSVQQLKETVAAAVISAEDTLKKLRRRGAVSVSTSYSFNRAGAQRISTVELPPEITEWMIESDSGVGDLFGEIQEDWFFSRAIKRGVCAMLTLRFDRLFWLKPLAADHYIDLVLSAVDRRRRTHADVELDALNPGWPKLFGNSDGATDEPISAIRLRIEVAEENLFSAADKARKVKNEICEVAEQLAASIASDVNAAKDRLSGWGDRPVDELASEIDQQTRTDVKGRLLEELALRLLQGVPGFAVTGRTRTLTEEIDIVIVNNSANPLWKRDGPLVLCECKNWSSKCGKDEFVIFHEKLKNRRGRSTLGLLVSWNGFTQTVTKEELRGSREDLLILPIIGKDLREAAFTGKFEPVLERVWQAVATL